MFNPMALQTQEQLLYQYIKLQYIVFNIYRVYHIVYNRLNDTHLETMQEAFVTQLVQVSYLNGKERG